MHTSRTSPDTTNASTQHAPINNGLAWSGPLLALCPLLFALCLLPVWLLLRSGVFFFVHFIMTAVHKRLLVSQREHVVFNTAMLLFAGALIMRTWAKHVYHRTRPLLVLVLHIALTVLRASAVNSMSSKQVQSCTRCVPGCQDAAAAVICLCVLCLPFCCQASLLIEQW